MFKKLPGLPELFLDFIYNYPAVAPFYPVPPFDLQAIAERARLVSRLDYPRRELAQVLVEQNVRFGAGARALANARRIADGAVAVVTGQQAGLFTGPALTIYKALTAIRMAEALEKMGIAVVPLFWIASDDHDYAEVASTYFLGEAGASAVEYRFDEEERGKPIGDILIGPQIFETIERLERVLPAGAGREGSLELIRSCYRPAEGYASAFAGLMARLLGERGLVLIDPSSGRLKRLARGLFARAIRESELIDRTLEERGAQLRSARYRLQVGKPKSHTLLFGLEHGKRVPVSLSDRLFYIGNSKGLTLEEVLEELERAPEQFSPSVLLRPLVQDTLLPTAVYIGGASEISYFGQAFSLYRFFARPEPALVPRASFTIIEPHVSRVIEKYHLKLEDLFADLDELLQAAAARTEARGAIALLDDTAELLKARLESLDRLINELDPTLSPALARSRDKMLYQLNKIRSKCTAAAARRDETARRQLERARSSVYPLERLQERALNIFYFIARYGYNLLDRLYGEVEVERIEHKTVSL